MTVGHAAVFSCEGDVAAQHTPMSAAYGMPDDLAR